MEYENTDVEQSINRMLNYQKDIKRIEQQLSNKFISDINDNIWKSSAKKFFIDKCNNIEEKLKSIDTLLDKSLEDLNKIKEIKRINQEIAALKVENEALRVSQLPSDINKMLQNNQKIENYTEMNNKTEISILNNWR